MIQASAGRLRWVITAQGGAVLPKYYKVSYNGLSSLIVSFALAGPTDCGGKLKSGMLAKKQHLSIQTFCCNNYLPHLPSTDITFSDA